jgi:phosphatidylglycerophosphate synthase
MVARRTGRTSLFGSVLDIAADRTYELVLWVGFADLRMVPMVLPLLVVARTTLTDALRSVEIGRGTAPFAQHRSPLARFLVASSWMRTGYSVGKVTTFCGLALTRALSGGPAVMVAWLRVIAWLTVIICVVRGLPVIVGSLRRHLAGSPRTHQARAQSPNVSSAKTSRHASRHSSARRTPCIRRHSRSRPGSAARGNHR